MQCSSLFAFPKPRHLLLCALSITLGALTTISVAWGCVWWSAVPSTSRPIGVGSATIGVGTNWGVREETAAGAERVFVEWRSRSDLHPQTWSGFMAALPKTRPAIPIDLGGAYQAFLSDSRGWPRLALTATCYADAFTGDTISENWQPTGGVRLPDRRGWPETEGLAIRLLPLTPIWSGFVFDTILFAAAWIPLVLIIRIGLATIGIWTWRRRLLLLASILTVGIVATIGVSWLCCFRAAEEETNTLSVWTYDDTRNHNMWIRRFESLGTSWLWASWNDAHRDRDKAAPRVQEVVAPWEARCLAQPGEPGSCPTVFAWGWPCRSTYGRFEYAANSPAMGELISATLTSHEGSFNILDDPPIPLRPLWRGFCVDVLFYSAACALLLAVLAVPRHLLHRWRTARGKCWRCGYVLFGTDICSECGSPSSCPMAGE